MASQQIYVIFSGLVQGVGFRYTTARIASKLDIKGWVKNLSDGKVEVVAQAPEDKLKIFLNEVQEYFNSYIKDVVVDWLPATENLCDFNIKF